MGTTYTTSTECAYYSGMPTQDAYTRPNTNMIDAFRDQAYRLITRIIGSGTADINGFAKGMELKLVDMKIQGILNGASYVMRMTEDEENDLKNVFNVQPIYVWVPDDNGNISGS
jgi:hypothetical protein